MTEKAICTQSCVESLSHQLTQQYQWVCTLQTERELERLFTGCHMARETLNKDCLTPSTRPVVLKSKQRQNYYIMAPFLNFCIVNGRPKF